jgi:predicted 3-demethylubiquinone-9 3-methyltransferase (glyoxalase superfamily)
MSKKITPCLWFDQNAEEAIAFYKSIFPDTKVGEVLRWGEAGHGEPGSVLTMEFNLMGQDFLALNGGPEFKFNESVSFIVNCKDQAEVDRYWMALTADGGEESMCGWLKDKYGLSWQITPEKLPELLRDRDPERADRAMKAMLTMRKIDLKKLEEAAEGKVAV